MFGARKRRVLGDIAPSDRLSQLTWGGVLLWPDRVSLNTSGAERRGEQSHRLIMSGRALLLAKPRAAAIPNTARGPACGWC